MTKRPWHVLVNSGDEYRSFATFEQAEQFARKRAKALFALDDGISSKVEVHWNLLTVARIKIDALERIWTDLIDTTDMFAGFSDARAEIVAATAAKVERADGMPNPPHGLAEIEGVVAASTAYTILLPVPVVREIIAYVRELEARLNNS